jgi:putative ABC transport system ATP-binding protein
MALVEIEGLSRRFGPLAALDDLTLAIEPGEWVAVTGPSGSGKTTLLNILSGLDRPSAGRVRVGGTDLSQLGARDLARYRQQTVGLVFQQFHLIPYLTALENVMLAQYVHSMTDRGEAVSALRQVGLGERLQHLPSQLSGGEQQRVCIARALINQPPLILADEPTGNLDAVNEAVVMTLLSDLHRRGHTLVLVTHDPTIAARASREVRLEHGRLAVWRYGEPGAGAEEVQPVLAELWRQLEEDGGTVSVSQRGVAELLAQGMLAFAGTRIELTPRGREQSAAAVRRIRLAEALLARTLARGSVAEECGRATPVAAGFEDQVCAFLGHPARCPHGRLIAPLGPCCGEEAAAAAGTATGAPMEPRIEAAAETENGVQEGPETGAQAEPAESLGGKMDQP